MREPVHTGHSSYFICKCQPTFTATLLAGEVCLNFVTMQWQVAKWYFTLIIKHTHSVFLPVDNSELEVNFLLKHFIMKVPIFRAEKKIFLNIQGLVHKDAQIGFTCWLRKHLPKISKRAWTFRFLWIFICPERTYGNGLRSTILE